MKRWVTILLCIGGLLPPVAQAHSEPDINAQDAANMLELARQILQEADSARNRVAALTQTIQAYESGLVALRQSLRQAARQEEVIRRAFEAERERLAALLAMMQSMQAEPQTLLLHPEGPLATAQAGMIMADIWPTLEAEVSRLRHDLEEVLLLQSLQESTSVALESGLSEVQVARLQLSQALADRTDLPRRFAEDTSAMQTLLENSETLRAFASGLTSLPGTESLANDLVISAGDTQLQPPVTGTILRRFNEPDAAGIAHPGWVIATQPQALVTAPWPATIRYRGPLLSYGTVVILEPEQDMLMVLAGLGEAFGEVGEIVAKGAPLGLMPEYLPGNDAELSRSIVIDAGAARSETLYMELRKNHQPVDPAIWFAGEKD